MTVDELAKILHWILRDEGLADNMPKSYEEFSEDEKLRIYQVVSKLMPYLRTAVLDSLGPWEKLEIARIYLESMSAEQARGVPFEEAKLRTAQWLELEKMVTHLFECSLEEAPKRVQKHVINHLQMESFLRSLRDGLKIDIDSAFSVAQRLYAGMGLEPTKSQMLDLVRGWLLPLMTDISMSAALQDERLAEIQLWFDQAREG